MQFGSLTSLFYCIRLNKQHLFKRTIGRGQPVLYGETEIDPAGEEF